MKSTEKIFAHIAEVVERGVGSGIAFMISIILVAVCITVGVVYNYSEIWMIMNTISSVVTFLIVILIQNAQNRDTLSIHIKLNELIRAHDSARNQLIDLDVLTDTELRELELYYKKLSEKSKKEKNDKREHD